MIFKIFWIFRGLFYKFFFGRFLLPSYIGKPTYIGGFSKIYIGRNVRIFPNARMEAIGKNGKILIGNNVAIAQNVHITSARNLNIGNDSTILQNVMITNIDHEYTHIGQHILEQPHLISDTCIGENCFIGFGAVIQAGTVLGKQCIVGANSVVRGTFPDFCVLVGVPARIIKRYDMTEHCWRRTDSYGNFLTDSK